MNDTYMVLYRTLVICAIVGQCLASCSTAQVYFEKNCERISDEAGHLFFKTTKSSLKQEVKRRDRLYYLGSDNNYHYFWYNTDTHTKFAAGVVLPATEEIRLERIPYNFDVNYDKKSQIRLADL